MIYFNTLRDTQLTVWVSTKITYEPVISWQLSWSNLCVCCLKLALG